jgi:hypothetical protein
MDSLLQTDPLRSPMHAVRVERSAADGTWVLTVDRRTVPVPSGPATVSSVPE